MCMSVISAFTWVLMLASRPMTTRRLQQRINWATCNYEFASYLIRLNRSPRNKTIRGYAVHILLSVISLVRFFITLQFLTRQLRIADLVPHLQWHPGTKHSDGCLHLVTPVAANAFITVGAGWRICNAYTVPAVDECFHRYSSAMRGCCRWVGWRQQMLARIWQLRALMRGQHGYGIHRCVQ